MKKKSSTIILILIFLVGLSLLLYPTVSGYINALHQSSAIAEYTNELAKVDQELYEQEWKQAQDYNDRLLQNGVNFHLSDDKMKEYNQQLDLSSSGVIAYITIPSINCELPIYHGTDDGTLQRGIGHLEWTALPIGGSGTHCVLSGHRGLPSSRLFTDLDQVVLGDIFQITVLDKVLTYEVDQIRIVEPEDTSELLPEAEKDYCTLITCTPYGINSHRLLVRGTRIETPEKAQRASVTANAVQIEPILIAPLIAIPILLILLAVLLAGDSRRKKEASSNE